MARRIIGIDPGKEGAVAVLDVAGDLCIVERLCDVKPCHLYIWAMPNDAGANRPLILIEKAQARPGQGVSSMFNYGTGFGRLIGWCEALELPYQLVPPATWTRVMHAGTSGTDAKARSLQAAQRLFPSVPLTVGKSKKPHTGLVDALLIAEYGVRTAA